ncbi:hypothetical protein Sste5346_000489 [Sporothrix stenoceras]|uniref:Uncharacterized protein n=1 Tax=Sporothrix stenoceras TaxID=5173 RepID=A0ABR3ZRU7_9PEZI
MAALPRQFPDLAIHLTDQTRTPIVSSASGWGRDEEEDEEEEQHAVVTADGTTKIKPTRQQRAAALDDLATTALRSRDAAARLGLGADMPRASDAEGPDGSSAALLAALGMTPPEHMVVTYSTGSVVIDSFLDPRQQRRRQRQQTQISGASSLSPGQGQGQGQGSGNQVGTNGNGDNDNNSDIDDNDAEDAAGGRAPLLLGLVAAPDAQSLGDARRATARLERVGLAVQQELAAQNRR